MARLLENISCECEKKYTLADRNLVSIGKKR